ncbi:MAG: type II and III secretion system protein [Armatimonadetes bacterium]|nr:type II and III secretion system protein [Armatimonadota bacterium]
MAPLKIIKSLLLPAIFISLFLAIRHSAAVSYTNITDIESKQLSNGVQILIQSDGVLEWRPANMGGGQGGSGGGRKTTQFTIRLPEARYSGSSFINIDKFPVSYVQASIPQDAKEGVGVLLTVVMSVPSSYSVNTSADQQSVIITVNSERTLETTRRSGTSTTRTTAEKKMEVTVNEQGLVSVTALKADFHELIAEVARLTGISVAVDDGQGQKLRHEVSMNVSDVPVDQFLRTITSGYGLALDRQEGLYMISGGVPNDLAAYHLSGTRSFPMQFIRAQTASGLLPTFLFSYLHVNEAQNAVVVSAPTQMLDKIGRDLGRVDLAAPQIMIEALAVEFTNTNDLNYAISADFVNNAANAALDSATGTISYQTVGKLPRTFNARLNALISKGRARIRANPRMAALNGQEAELFIGAQRFILVRFQQFGGTTERIQGVDVGVKLRVAPWTGGNGEITTQIAPEVSNISEVDPVTGLPVLSTRRANTTVRVKDGETVVIGGLVLKQTFNTRRKVPILGDIPFLGYAFRSTSKSTTESELAIFVTPRILTDAGRLPNAAEEQRIRDTMLQENPPQNLGPIRKDLPAPAR